MIHGYSEPMEDVYADHDVDSSQQPTQTQEASQQPVEDPAWDHHLWAFMTPCRPDLTRLDFWRTLPSINIGRGSTNHILLPSLKISNKHCTISWDGKQDSTSVVTVDDHSSNGTFINGNRIGKGRHAILRDGNEIGFGAWGNQSGPQDYRYVFRFTAPGPPTSGLYALYDIGHELGKGSFATVMSAVCRMTGEMFAVKMIHRSRFRQKDDQGMVMFQREISILEKLEHPNICNLKETFVDDQNIHLVLEYINGGDLLDYIIDQRGLSEEQAQYFTHQLCDALKYIHSLGIAHRDLKPENVLLTRSNPPILKVADFGLAKAVDSMTKFKTTCGTPCYLAPEVILRNPEQGYDQLVDSWSVGVIVFSMLTNTSPFIEDDTLPIQVRFRGRYIDWGMLTNAGASADAVDFVRRLLDDDPQTRMSCSDALEHPWLAPYAQPQASQSQGSQTSLPTPRRLEPEFSYESAGGDFSSALSVRAGTFGSQQAAAHPNGAGGGTGIAADFEHIQMEDAAAHIPASQGNGLSQSQRLARRPMEVAERDPAGALQSFEVIPPAPIEAGPSPARKRKEYSGRMDDSSSESSLTPVSEDKEEDEEEEEDATPAPAAPVRNLRNAKKAVKAPPQAHQGRGARGKAPAKRTRASVRRNGDANGDVDM